MTSLSTASLASLWLLLFSVGVSLSWNYSSAWEATVLQIPFLQSEGRHIIYPDSSSDSPFDDKFDKFANWVLGHFQTPGLAVAVLRGDGTFTKVCTHLGSLSQSY
jgi:hypothetical protein